MGREKRKGRLNKGEASEFIGFGAFGDVPATVASVATNTHDGTSPEPKSPSKGPSLAPVYMGSDSQLSLLFPRIGQKRDATTKTKALQDLRDFFATTPQSKKTHVDALAHFLYLYQTKLHYDNTPRVRSASLECCHQALLQVPKAFSSLCSQQPELIGMMLSGRADPATDVSKVAYTFADSLGLLDISENLINEGVWAYVERILSYGKPIQMHQELFQKKSQDSKLSEKQEEELEERFVRIVGTAIEGLQIHLPVQSRDLPTSEYVRYLWKTLTSQKAVLRRKTYDLLSTCCRKVPSLIDQNKLSNILLQNLSSEKEPTNVKLLLETLLAFVASVPPTERTALLAQYSKALTKLFSKGCHGATQWAPTVLPIVALLPVDDQPNILTSIWQGNKHLVGAADQLEVIAAVAETSSFLLLRQSHDLVEVVAKCWLQALQVFVTRSIGNSNVGPLVNAYDALGKVLAKGLQAMDGVEATQTHSAMTVLKDWFWNTELPKVLVSDADVDLGQMTTFVKQFPSAKVSPNILKIWRSVFRHNVEVVAGMIPTEDLYKFWMFLLDRISVDQIFDEKEREHFLMNDLLRWMVIHTSSLSDQFSLTLAKRDFELYDKCKTAVSWEPILRELVAAKCDLEALSSGLVILSESSGLESVKSSILEDLCKQVAKESIVELHADEGGDSEDEYTEATELNRNYHRKAGDLLQTCVGLGDVNGLLVGDGVTSSWVDMACPIDKAASRSTNPVLETLVALIKDDYFAETSTVARVLIQAWRQGGDLWMESVVYWIKNNSKICKLVVTAASNELKQDLNSWSSDVDYDEDLMMTWSERAVRLFQICNDSDSNDIPIASIDLIGLGDTDVWDILPTTQNNFASSCFLQIMELLDEYDGNASEFRFSLIANTAADNADGLLVRILLYMSSGSMDLLSSADARSRADNSYLLLQKLGGKGIPEENLKGLIKAAVSTMLKAAIKEECETLPRGVAVLSQLISIGFSSLKPADSDEDSGKLEVDQIREGDNVWYILNTSNLGLREPCTIVKIHNDLPNEVYFTIRVEREGRVQERQTVGERLRSNSSESNSDATHGSVVSVNTIQQEESKRRQMILSLVMDHFVQKTWNDWGETEFEILNVIISQLGILGPRGIGSAHYTIFQKLVAHQVALIDMLDCVLSDKTFPAAQLWSLTLALGYGRNSPASTWNLALLGFDPEDTVDSLLFLFNGDAESDSEEEEGKEANTSTTKAPQVRLESPSITSMRPTIAFLSVVLSKLQDEDTREDARSLLFRFVTPCLKRAKEEFVEDDYIALRAIQSIPDGKQANTEADAIIELIGSFASRWENHEGASWTMIPLAREVLLTIQDKQPKLAGIAAGKYADGLATSLKSEPKRWLALRFLDTYAMLAKPIHESPQNIVNALTAIRIKTWSEGLLDEEVEEMEGDCESVCQWVPETLMNEVESWQDSTSRDYFVSEDDAYIRMTSWIAYLRIASTAGSKDSLYRTGLNTYTRKTGAVDLILDLAMAYANVSTDRKIKFAKVDNVDTLFSTSSTIELPKLAWAVLFRTVEVFPTLAKNWWETTCPTYFREPVREFVEAHVAPELLRRELQKTKTASSFGDMTVKGSLVSREVTALYTQDDFTLSVVIKLPPSFPFRRAEVDCSKTLGVPESRWKRWSLQITQMLNNQGGSLMDALVLWKENVDKEFEGIEPCPVCYSVLHVKTHKLPEMQCKTCNNRFHFDCLTQWFRSSGKNACVLCQQPWSGTRV